MEVKKKSINKDQNSELVPHLENVEEVLAQCNVINSYHSVNY